MKKVPVLDIRQFKSRDNAEDFYTDTLQNHLITRHKDIYLPHSHNFYLAVLFTRGSGMHEVDFTHYAVKPGALFFLNPGQTHHWKLSDDAEGYIFFHSKAFYELHYTHNKLSHFPFYYSMHTSPCIYLDTGSTKDLSALFITILDEYCQPLILQTPALLSLVELVYINSTRLYLQHNPADKESYNGYYIKFRQLEDFIEQHYRTIKSPSAYAALLSITAKHLNRITQQVAGKTATDVITDRILLEAKRELVLQQKSFNAIAHQLGYEDYAYFSRLFKNKTGQTPSGFLSRYQNS